MSAERADSLLRSLRGVRAARFSEVPFPSVHAVSDGSESVEEIVGRIRTALRADLGLELPAERVHVAVGDTIRTEEAEPRPRLLFRSVHVYRESNQAEAQVELSDGDQTRVGRASGPALRNGLVRLVAQATLDAVRAAIGDRFALEIVAVQRRRIAGRGIVLCHLALLQGREERHLSGSVLVTSDPFEATVFSVLDALNRVLPGPLSEDLVEYEIEDDGLLAEGPSGGRG